MPGRGVAVRCYGVICLVPMNFDTESRRGPVAWCIRSYWPHTPRDTRAAEGTRGLLESTLNESLFHEKMLSASALHVFVSLCLLAPPVAAGCWGSNTKTFPDCTGKIGTQGYLGVGYNCSGTMCARATCVGCTACTCPLCAVYYENAVLDASSGSCCARISDGSCIGQESGDKTASNDDDIYSGAEPEMVKKAFVFRQVGAWASCVAAGTLAGTQLYFMPEMKRQMRPRMLLILLGLDSLAGLFLGLSNDPTIALSNKYNSPSDSTNVGHIFSFLG